MKTQFVRKLFAPLAIVAALGLASGQGLAADIKERNLKFPIVNAIDHPQGLGAQKFVDVVGQKSGGKIKVKIFPTARWAASSRSRQRCRAARSKSR